MAGARRRAPDGGPRLPLGRAVRGALADAPRRHEPPHAGGGSRPAAVDAAARRLPRDVHRLLRLAARRGAVGVGPARGRGRPPRRHWPPARARARRARPHAPVACRPPRVRNGVPRRAGALTAWPATADHLLPLGRGGRRPRRCAGRPRRAVPARRLLGAARRGGRRAPRGSRRGVARAGGPRRRPGPSARRGVRRRVRPRARRLAGSRRDRLAASRRAGRARLLRRTAGRARGRRHARRGPEAHARPHRARPAARRPRAPRRADDVLRADERGRPRDPPPPPPPARRADAHRHRRPRRGHARRLVAAWRHPALLRARPRGRPPLAGRAAPSSPTCATRRPR